MDKQKHKLYMAQILTLIFKDKELCNLIAFKGGTALMFFHSLPRFSTDLDFNLLDVTKSDFVYGRIRKILLRFGKIDDEAKKLFSLLLVLDYGKGERMLKVEISTRQYADHYELLPFAGTDVRVMTLPDMFAHKLCAMGERMSPRDIFDVNFFLRNHISVNAQIIEERTGKEVTWYTAYCADKLRDTSPKLLMQGLGEVVEDGKTRTYIRSTLIEETATALKLFSEFPLIAAPPGGEGYSPK